jgi:cytochrome c5
MKKLSIITLFAILSACATKAPKASKEPSAPAFSTADVERAQAFYPGMDVASLSEAKSLYEMTCGNCHALKKPSAESEAKWRKVMPDMVRKSNKKGASLTPENEQQLLAYVLTMRTALN